MRMSQRLRRVALLSLLLLVLGLPGGGATAEDADPPGRDLDRILADQRPNSSLSPRRRRNDPRGLSADAVPMLMRNLVVGVGVVAGLVGADEVRIVQGALAAGPEAAGGPYAAVAVPWERRTPGGAPTATGGG